MGKNERLSEVDKRKMREIGDYESLPEEEKEKDRAQLKLAIEHVRKYKKMGKGYIEEKAAEFGLSDR